MKKGIYWFMQLVSAAGPRDSSNVGSSLVISVFWLYPDWKAKCQLQFQLYILMDYNPKKKRTFFFQNPYSKSLENSGLAQTYHWVLKDGQSSATSLPPVVKLGVRK